MIRAVRELDYSIAYILLRKLGKLEDKVERVNIAATDTKENRIGMNPII